MIHLILSWTTYMVKDIAELMFTEVYTTGMSFLQAYSGPTLIN